MRVAANFVSWTTATVIVVSAIVTIVLRVYVREGWQPLDDDGGSRKWRNGKILHIDRNRDGIVDEIEIELAATNVFLIKRDTDLDGWFDLQYELRSNIAVHIENIHEKAPKHEK
jgi:hypothetical protein